MTNVADYNVKERPQWCPGCGDHAIVGAIRSALAELDVPRHQAVISSGIGCSSKLPHYVNTYGFEGLHGRALPVASGIKLANHKLTVVVVGGDGDGYAIGAGHFVHIMRRNYDLTYIVHDNQLYGLTTGQASPTSQPGMKTRTTPYGVIETPFNPVAVAIINGATFVARTFAGDMPHLKQIVKEAIAHKGFAFVDVLQPCITFNRLNTYEFFTKRCYKLQGAGVQSAAAQGASTVTAAEHDVRNKFKALEKALEAPQTNYERIPIGIFYKEEKPTYEDQLPQLKDKALVEQELDVDISQAYEE